MKNERMMSDELDLLPENIHYRDEGCELSPSCLECPLESCVFDTPHGKRALLKRRRDEAMARKYRDEGCGISELAEFFKVSRRTVHRVLKACEVNR